MKANYEWVKSMIFLILLLIKYPSKYQVKHFSLRGNVSKNPSRSYYCYTVVADKKVALRQIH